MNNKSKSLIIILILICITSLLAISYSYVYFSTSNYNNMKASIKTANVKLEFSAGNSSSVISHIELNQEATPKDLVLENKSNSSSTVTISWKELSNNFTDGSLTYTVKRKKSLSSEYELVKTSTVPVGTNINTPIFAEVNLPANSKYYYQIIIKHNLLDNVNQTQDLNATMTSSFNIESGDKTDAGISLSKLKNISVSEPPTTFNIFNYEYDGSKNGWNDTKIVDETQGLYAAEDDFGVSYYFRGDNTLPNVVKLGKYQNDTCLSFEPLDRGGIGDDAIYWVETCGSRHREYDIIANNNDEIYWRIVRINGDGSLRLFNPNRIGFSEFNKIPGDVENGIKYAGYTYDNTAPDKGDGTPSNIKTYLEDWYNKVMLPYDNIIINGQFFYDTSGSVNQVDGNNYYSSYNRIKGFYEADETYSKPSLKTVPTDKTYGGVYYTKIGLLNVDEVVLIGGGISYIYDRGEITYTGSPHYTNNEIPSIYTKRYIGNITSGAAYCNQGMCDGSDPGQMNGAVINISREAWMSMVGSGTMDDPYRLSE